MITLVFDVLWQVVARYILTNPSSFTDELARYLLIWVGYLGAAYGTGKKIHLAIDILSKKIDRAGFGSFHAKTVWILIALFAIGVFVIGGGRLVYITLVLDQRSSALGLPLGYVYSVIPLSGILILLYAFENIINQKMRTA